MELNNKLRILMVSYEYPPLGGGGAKVVYGLSKELVRLGHEVDIVTMRFRGLPKYESINGVNVYRVPSIRTRESICNTPEMVSYSLSAILFLLRLVRQKHYHINHTHFIFPDGVVSYLLKKLTRFPYIITAHGSDVPGYNPDRFKLEHRLLTPLWKKVVKNAEQIICLSNSLESLALERSPNIKTVVIPNGIDLDNFQSNGDKQRRILIVSRMFERKGIQYFLQALKGLNHGYEVNIVGDGPYLNVLKKLSKDLKVKAKFGGWIDNSSLELKELYEKSSIFVFPSISENFPIVLLEAMAAGMAIITTKNTGCAEVVGDAALLVEQRNPEAIREALDRLISNPDFCKELGQAARKRLENNFTWASVSRQYADLYERYANRS